MKQQGHLSNPESQRRLLQLQKNKRRQYDADLKAVMSTREGRRFVWRIIFDTSRVLESCGSTVALELARHDGVRSVGLYLTNEARRVCPSEFVHMQSEQLQAQQEDDLQRESAKEAQESE